jgi:hypothetical protein
MATVHGKLKGVGDTDEDPGATVDIMLCGYGSRSPVCRGVGSENGSYYTAEMNSVPVSAPGNAFSVTVTGNDLIEPPGTYYTVTFRDPNGDILQCNAYIFLGSNDYDLTNTEPFDPSLPPAPLPPLIIPQLVIVPYSGFEDFDGTQGTAFQLTLAGDSDGSTCSNMIPGNLYTFIIIQDATGGHVFFWPSGPAPTGTRNQAYPICPTPGSITIQTFVAISTTLLLPIGPGTYTF